MDPVSHLLFGRTVALTVRRSPVLTGATAALVLGSILPDADAALAPIGFDLYLRAHASGTHSLLGTVVEALVLAFVLRVLVTGSRTLPLLAASCVGVLGHIFWDLADGSDISLFKPFSDAMLGWHLVAMGEPIVLVTLAAAVLVAWRWPARAQSVAGVALVLLSLFLAVKKTTQEWARARYAEAVVNEAPKAVAIAPRLGRLFTWTIYDRDGDRVRAWSVDGQSGEVTLAFEYRDAADASVVMLSRDLPVVRAFLGLSKTPFARMERDGPRRLVLWSDVSSCSIRGCDLSFGGAFDRNMLPLYQLIRIGGFSQRRPLPPGRP
ncbi:MAG TPA: metal-dependent hydrolase [Vicinamibacterales bacterium]|nr:metal-dependent hydrolase [Vicinamibacterales bacterium]